RERIESRVLAQLEESLPGLLAGDIDLGAPPKPPRRSVAKEIERLHDLRESGALTEEQYRRMVDRLVDSDER
ncbi:MAG TPA: hypothetical protein VFN76_03515, partial [Candidatus Limnocylindria bacterium]|nr:hypothetical protein [Candidatus Limnocylindria bacterium]